MNWQQINRSRFQWGFSVQKRVGSSFDKSDVSGYYVALASSRSSVFFFFHLILFDFDRYFLLITTFLCNHILLKSQRDFLEVKLNFNRKTVALYYCIVSHTSEIIRLLTHGNAMQERVQYFSGNSFYLRLMVKVWKMALQQRWDRKIIYGLNL